MASEHKNWEAAFVKLEQEAWREHQRINKKGGRLPVTMYHKQWRAIAAANRRTMGQALLEYRNRQRDFDAFDEPNAPEDASIDEYQAHIAKLKEYDTIIRRYEDAITTLIAERRDHGGEDRFGSVQLLSDLRERIRGLLNDVRNRREGSERAIVHLRGNREEPQSRTKNERHASGLLSNKWVGGPELGRGGYGSAQLWLKIDPRGRIVDRMAIKDTIYYETQVATTWDSAGNIPNEIRAMYKLRPLRGSECIVKPRSWRISKPQRMYRIYMDFCPHGSLDNIIAGHTQRNGGLQTKYMPPAPFAWKLFEDLVTAGVLMERGDLQDPGMLGDWSLIVHRDIKPGNIFLANNTSDSFKGYPTAVLGDFGLCAMLSADDKRTAEAFRLPPYAFSVPEQVNENLVDASAIPNPQRLTTKSNVWQIGMIMWCYLKGTYKGQADLTKFDWKTYRQPEPFNSKQVEIYSSELCKLVMECLEYLPEKRPGFDDILKSIRRHTRPGKKDLAHGLRWAPADDKGFTKYAVLLHIERYPLRSMLSEWQRSGDAPQPPTRPARNKDGSGSDSESSSDDSFGGETGADMTFPEKPREDGGVPPPPPPPNPPPAGGGPPAAGAARPPPTNQLFRQAVQGKLGGKQGNPGPSRRRPTPFPSAVPK